jgi:hypothetical protein
MLRRVPEYWKEELVPNLLEEFRDDDGVGGRLHAMLLAGGGRPGWMWPRFDRQARRKLAGLAGELKTMILSWVELRSAPLSSHLAYQMSARAIDLDPWWFAGTTVDAESIHLWFHTRGEVRGPRLNMIFDTDIVVLSFPRAVAGPRALGDDEGQTEPEAAAEVRC